MTRCVIRWARAFDRNRQSICVREFFLPKYDLSDCTSTFLPTNSDRHCSIRSLGRAIDSDSSTGMFPCNPVKWWHLAISLPWAFSKFCGQREERSSYWKLNSGDSVCSRCFSVLYLNMRNNWSISESPWNSGLRVAISAKMQPIDQMSTWQEYRCEPNKISGALYHNVTISCV